jgi:serine/threonine-protein kinase
MRPSGTICVKCGEALSPGARFCASCGTPIGNADGSRTSQPKQIIDARYLVLQEFSRGAFGVTYLVRDMSVNMTRVLKLGPKADAAAGLRFVREATAMGVIRHPNLASVVSSSATPDGAPYLVMEHVPGPNLGQILEDGPLARADALAVALGIADALQALHARQVLHRDVKPQNIVVPEEAGAFQFKRAALVDFGVFGELVRRQSGAQTTQAGQIFGTPVYMSPEQLSGSAQSAATDVYGLGLVLFEMLTGKRPYGAGNTSEQVFRRLATEVEIGAEEPLTAGLRVLLRGILRRIPT